MFLRCRSESLLMFRCVNPCEPHYSLLFAAYQDYDGIAVGNADHSRGERFSAGGSDEREDEQREETASKLQISFHSIHRKKKGSRDLPKRNRYASGINFSIAYWRSVFDQSRLPAQSHTIWPAPSIMNVAGMLRTSYSELIWLLWSNSTGKS